MTNFFPSSSLVLCDCLSIMGDENVCLYSNQASVVLSLSLVLCTCVSVFVCHYQGSVDLRCLCFVWLIVYHYQVSVVLCLLFMWLLVYHYQASVDLHCLCFVLLFVIIKWALISVVCVLCDWLSVIQDATILVLFLSVSLAGGIFSIFSHYQLFALFPLRQFFLWLFVHLTLCYLQQKRL